jgi:glutamate dehydrogenase/leucine dehydrogenase
MNNPFKNAMIQLDKAAEIAKIDKNKLELLKKPDRVVQVKVPVEMDSGEIKIFDGYRVQYNNVLGPYKGGLRFAPAVDLDEVKALSFWMAIKTAVLDLPLGGGKGGVTVNPKELSEKELENLTRSFTRGIAPVIGSRIDVPAPDVYTNAQVMEWIVDEYGKVNGKEDLGVVTGKPLSKGGSKGRDRATAMGGFYLLQEIVEDKYKDKEIKVAIQGFGNAGSIMADLCQAEGYKVVAVSDSKGGIYNAEGLDIEKVKNIKKEKGSVVEVDGVKVLTNEEILEVEADVLVPAALENQITKDNADRIKASFVIELANGPTIPDADNILGSMGITVIPDVLANAGGVTVSYFEWKQNLEDNYWSEDEVFAQLKPKMIDAYNLIKSRSKELNIDYRTAAFIVAVERIIAKI